ILNGRFCLEAPRLMTAAEAEPHIPAARQARPTHNAESESRAITTPPGCRMVADSMPGRKTFGQLATLGGTRFFLVVVKWQQSLASLWPRSGASSIFLPPGAARQVSEASLTLTHRSTRRFFDHLRVVRVAGLMPPGPHLHQFRASVSPLHMSR